jgi:hypothetical protein
MWMFCAAGLRVRAADTDSAGFFGMEGSGVPGPEWAAGCHWWWPKRWEC